MRLQRHLIVFVKAPRLGAVKTRLAADVGAFDAWRFYRATTARILQRLGRDSRWTCRLAITPDRFARRGRFWPRQLIRIPQGRGDLGARMARPFACLPPGPVVIIGSDIPDVSPIQVASAFRALERHDAVFGPAVDGGYWLVGLSPRTRRMPIFRDVRWSTPDALADTLTNLPAHAAVAFVDELADIDDGADFLRWRRSEERTAQSVPSSAAPSRDMSSTKLQGRYLMSSW